ncbi:PhoH family protein [Raineya orbicola]|uniref:PhoH-like protein n=1 Tax=Raineya orbicola TaxID=2016530 RepID=A0A2N3IEW3_9BACT|nr:PhoH family protein [Raineya orbicola]PKQ68874.1 Phosphate starvation-inducible protein PhoH putative ATPase [Raineya orbicola]
MIEKIITLENIPLVDFLGAENSHIKQIAAAFPTSKILSRGNEIRIQGQTPEILKINAIINALLTHYHKFGKITPQNIEELIVQNDKEQKESSSLEKIREEVILYGTKGFGIKPRTQNQALMVKASMENDLVFALGPAGTGKTYIAVALAVQALKNKQVKKIIITRPAVEAGENLGFLPGDLKEKVDPYLRPIYDALDDMIQAEKLKFYLENRIIEIAPLAYMRGRTLSDAFILLDEAQNTTPMQMKMFLTRMGANSKAIVTGDQSQIDLPSKQRSGLTDALRILKDIEGIAVVELDARDVVRHRLVKAIIQAYDKAENSREN